MSETRLIARIVAAAMMVLGAQTGYGQMEPNRPIRMLTSGFGGGTDFVARQIATGLTAGLGQPVIVENRGSSVVPGDVVSKASPDGHTLLVTSGGILWAMPFFQKVPYDPVKDFSPVTLSGSFPSILVVNASVPANSIKEFIAVAKARPGALNYVMTAEGGSAHLSAALFNVMAGIKLVPVPYKNTGTAITDLIGGQIQVFFSASGPVMPHVKSGRLKALGITSAKTSALLPDLPTIAATLPGYDMEAVYCIFAPAKTPAAIVNHLNQEILRVLSRADVKEKFLAAGIEPRGSSPAELGALRKSDMTKLSKLIKDAGIGAQ